MNAKELIQLNNQKREQLNKENEEYYEKMLVYMRAHLFLSEQQTEELLMELLDHLLEAQAQGKRAEDVFGENPVAYCDDMIKQLPKEQMKSTALFVGYLVLYLAGWLALIRGLALLALQLLKQEMEQTVYLGKEVVIFLITVVFIFLSVWLVLKVMKRTIYTEVHKFKMFMTFFLIFASCIGVIFFAPRLVPPFGMAVTIGWYVYLFMGGVLIAVTKWMNHKYRVTK